MIGFEINVAPSEGGLGTLPVKKQRGLEINKEAAEAATT